MAAHENDISVAQAFENMDAATVKFYDALADMTDGRLD